MIWFVIKNILNRKLRSFLSCLGIIIGSFSIFTLFSIGKGVFAGVEEAISSLGTNKLLVVPMSLSGFSEKDITQIEKYKDVKLALPIKAGRIMKDGELILIYGIGKRKVKEMFEDTGYRIADGRYLKKGHECVLGKVAKKIFDAEVGKTIEIAGEKFKVVGILEGTGSQFDDSSVVILESAYNELFGKSGYSFVLVKTKKDPEIVSEGLREYLKKRRGKEDFRIVTGETLLKSVSKIKILVQIFFLATASISLVVGSIGVMNSIYTSVFERFRIIGLLRSIGASRKQILKIFLMESVIICAIGGIMGTLLGYLATLSSEKIIKEKIIEGYKCKVDAMSFLIPILFSLLSGLVAGYFPAKKAASIHPAEALRYE